MTAGAFLSALGIVALVPAAVNAEAPVIAVGGVVLPICTGDGQVHLAPLPGGAPSGVPGPGKDGSCCAKGCHGGSRRKPLRGDAGAAA